MTNCVALRNKTTTLTTLTTSLNSNQLAEATNWLHTQNKILRDQIYTRKQRRFKQHLTMFKKQKQSENTTTTDIPTVNRTVTRPSRGGLTTETPPMKRNKNWANKNSRLKSQDRKCPTNPKHRNRKQPEQAANKNTGTQSSSPITSSTGGFATTKTRGIESSINATPITPADMPPKATRAKQRRRQHRGRRRFEVRPNINNHKTVVNLSNRELTEPEVNILSKGLKFVPTATSIDKTELIADVIKWSRHMRLREFFAERRKTSTKKSTIVYHLIQPATS